MEIKFFGAWWGLDHLNMEDLIKKIKLGGYDGVEIGIPTKKSNRDELHQLLKDYDLEIIAHQYHASGSNPKQYAESLNHFIRVAAEFGPLLINSHTGKDFWNIEANLLSVDLCDDLEDEYGIPIVHETHRGRFLYSSSMALKYFKRRPKLKINFDLSHWCCVSESLLENQPDAVEQAIQRAHHIHARVGHAQGPQITDIRNPYWNNEVETFIDWWKKIFFTRSAEGKDFMTMTPEFGPLPYSPIDTNGLKSYIDFFEQNTLLKDYIKKHEQSWKIAGQK